MAKHSIPWWEEDYRKPNTIYEGDYILYRKGGKGRVVPGQYRWPEPGGHLVWLGVPLLPTEAYGSEPDLELVDLSEIVHVPITRIREVEALTPAQQKAWFDAVKKTGKPPKPRAAKPARKLPRAADVGYVNFPGQSTSKPKPKAKAKAKPKPKAKPKARKKPTKRAAPAKSRAKAPAKPKTRTRTRTQTKLSARDYFNMGKKDLVALGTAGAIKELKRRGRDASGNKVR